MSKDRLRMGTTLVETIAAMLIVSLAILMLSQAIVISEKIGKRASEIEPILATEKMTLGSAASITFSDGTPEGKGTYNTMQAYWFGELWYYDYQD